MQGVKKARATLDKLFLNKDWPRKEYLGEIVIIDHEGIRKANRDGERIAVWLFHNCENFCRMFSTDGIRIYELNRQGRALPKGLFKKTRKKPK